MSVAGSGAEAVRLSTRNTTGPMGPPGGAVSSTDAPIDILVISSAVPLIVAVDPKVGSVGSLQTISGY
jgi:hypothetical protein